MQGNFMIEKRCKINVKKADFIVLSCKKCGGETHIPFKTDRLVEICSICGTGFGAQISSYSKRIREIHLFADENADISIVSVEP